MQVSAYSNSFRFRLSRAIHIQNLSNRCRHKYDPSISQFFQSNFWRVFDVWHNCALGGAKPTPAMTEGVRGLEVSVIF